MDRTISQLADQLINHAPLYTRDRINGSWPPSEPGVYGLWFVDGTLPLVPITKCVKRDGRSFLYVGIVPERRGSARTLQNRIVDNHFDGKATNSILRTNLGLLLERQLGTAPKKYLLMTGALNKQPKYI
jgi:hypothetical protein